MMRKGHKCHCLPTDRGPGNCVPPLTVTVCQFLCWNMYWCAAPCVAGVPASVYTSAGVGPSHGARLRCAVPWLGLGGKVALPAAPQHPSVCTTTNPREQISNCADMVCQWRPGDTAVMAERPLMFSRCLNTRIFAPTGCISLWVMFTLIIFYPSPFMDLCTWQHWYFHVPPAAYGSLEAF